MMQAQVHKGGSECDVVHSHGGSVIVTTYGGCQKLQIISNVQPRQSKKTAQNFKRKAQAVEAIAGADAAPSARHQDPHP
eukprot:scaffold109923_cov30-Tisochrysis_lutea.AAC.8